MNKMILIHSKDEQTTFEEEKFFDIPVDGEDPMADDSMPIDVEGIGAAGDYTPRLTEPSYSDKNWIRYDKGGYNYCIEIQNGSCLSNCVGYAWGRWRELLGEFHKLSRGNAENWFGNTSDGYKRGQTPKLGAVICWAKGKAGNASDGAGHVAVVEKINPDGSILTSNSDYAGRRFYTKTIKAPYSLGTKYTFQGFIYLPEEEIKVVKKSNAEIAKEVVAGKWGNGNSRKKNLEAAGYSYAEIQKEVNKLLANNSKEKIEEKKSSTLSIGDKVKVLKAITYEGKKFIKWFSSYDVISINKDRIVIGRGKSITAAVHKDNLQKL